MQPFFSIAVLAAVVLSFLAIERGLSPLVILYGITVGCVTMMI